MTLLRNKISIPEYDEDNQLLPHGSLRMIEGWTPKESVGPFPFLKFYTTKPKYQLNVHKTILSLSKLSFC